jgi:hypothetical protein
VAAGGIHDATEKRKNPHQYWLHANICTGSVESAGAEDEMGAFRAAYVVVLQEGIPAPRFIKDKSAGDFSGRYITSYQTRIKFIFYCYYNFIFASIIRPIQVTTFADPRYSNFQLISASYKVYRTTP